MQKHTGMWRDRSHGRGVLVAGLRVSLIVIGSAACWMARAEYVGSTPPAVEIIDQRPAAEQASKSGSLLISSCDYAVRQLGDHDLRFDRVASLRDALQNASAAKLAGRPVTLVHYGIYINPAEIFRRGAQAAAFHIVEVGGVDRGSHCAQEKMSGGWYGPGESTTRFAPIVVEIGFLVDGARRNVRTVYSPDRDPVRYRSDESAALVLSAARQAEQAVVEELSL